MKLEEYGFIGDLHTGALIHASGTVEWLCLPRFDSESCMAALLDGGNPERGCWEMAPVEGRGPGRQRYRSDTLILETEFDTGAGTVGVIDFMPPGGDRHDVVRIVEGRRGTVEMKLRLLLRFDFGRTIPWIRHQPGDLQAIAGPHAVAIRSPKPLDVDDDGVIRARFRVAAGERTAFALTWHHSERPTPEDFDAEHLLQQTERFWRDWSGRCTYRGEWREAVMRSLITLKALTYQPTGGVVAAPTTSLPEHIGGVRNWDYRYCWVRDATFTLFALLKSGFTEEGDAWTEWLDRAVGGRAEQIQILYAAAGERRLPEFELKHLHGYENSRPVRIGNAATEQLQLDIFGEVLDVTHLRRQMGYPTAPDSWRVQRRLVDYVAEHWREPDEGIWEVRGPPRHFTHSRVMAWVALDRGIKAVEQFGLEGDAARWRRLREEIHADVCAHGYNRDRGYFTQYYGSTTLDGSLLMLPLVGFLPATDPRVERTILAIRDQLACDGLVYRYDPRAAPEVDGLPPGEGAFLACSFWLVDALSLLGRHDEARALFERLLRVRTPLGLLSEEYDCEGRRLVGNFPQAITHVSLVNSALNLAGESAPARQRSQGQHGAAGR